MTVPPLPPPPLRVADVMLPHPVTIGAGRTLAEAARLFRTSQCSDLMVVEDDGRWIGVLSEGDVLRALLPAAREVAGASLADATPVLLAHAAQVAARPVRALALDRVIRLSPGDSLVRAAAVMASMQIRRLPVVDASGALVGALGRAELVDGLLARATGVAAA